MRSRWWRMDKRVTSRVVSRRSVVEGVACAGVVLALGGAVRAFAGTEELLRPPGAQDEQRLIARCIRCDRCREACPTGAIGVGKLADGVLNARTPRMDFRSGACDMCEGRYRCAAACPTGAIGAFDQSGDAIGVAVVDVGVCQLYGYSAHCSAPCISSCAYGALSLDGNDRWAGDEAACNGCGACEFACPASSYGSYAATGKRGINVEVLKGGSRATHS